MLGTLRPDGAPRLSGTEVTIDDHEVTVGMMPGSRKLGDVRRDPRAELHSAPLEADLAEGDARLAGLLVEEPASPDAPGALLRLAIHRVHLVQVADDQLQLTTWDVDDGLRIVRRR